MRTDRFGVKTGPNAHFGLVKLKMESVAGNRARTTIVKSAASHKPGYLRSLSFLVTAV